MVNPKLEVALEYAANGFFVFPCAPKSKRPATENGFKDATRDPAQIRAWWSHNPDYNPAFDPDRSGLAVIDLDGETGIKAYEAVAIEFQLKPTYKVRTPRGGYHLYFTGELPSSVWSPKSKRCLGEHIDTRGVGSYALLPTSFVDDGKAFGTYEVIDDRHYAPMNPAVAIRLRKREAITLEHEGPRDAPINIGRAIARLKACVASGHVSIALHGGDDTAFGIACELVGDLGLFPGTAANLMLEHWYPFCRPSNVPDWVREKCRNAGRYCENTPGAKHVPPASEVFAAAAASLPEEPKPDPKKNPFYFLSDAEQDAANDPEWLVEGLIPRKGSVLWQGQKADFKTFLVEHLALCITANLPAFGFKTLLPGAVFYGAYEGRDAVQKARKNAWKRANSVPPSSITELPFYVAPGARVVFAEHCEMFKQAIRDRMVHSGIEHIRMIVLDTYAKGMVGLDELKATDAGKFVAFVYELIDEFECAVVTVHHLGKDRDKGGRGSSALECDMETVIRCKRHPKTLYVEVEKAYQKEGGEGDPFYLKGRVVDNTLVFDIISQAEHITATDTDTVKPKDVANALKVLKAFDPSMVTSYVLANNMVPRAEGETEQQREVKVTALRNNLASLAKTKGFQLMAVQAPDGSLQWQLPANTPSRK